jgi:uncharacterized small protein (DUF1192 family)
MAPQVEPLRARIAELEAEVERLRSNARPHTAGPHGA